MMGTVSTPGSNIAERKKRHLEICIDEDRYAVENGSTGLSSVHFLHRALPEVDEPALSTDVEFLGYRIALPILISSMTGGSSESYRVNKDLALAAAETGIPVGMGSVRILFRKPEVIDDFRLKRLAPNVPVLGNIGGVQLTQLPLGDLAGLLSELEVDGVAVHLNPGQELFQPEGDRRFSGILDSIRSFCEISPVPVIVKETGFGLAPHEVDSLFAAGAKYVNVAGSGGTNWITVEAYRDQAGFDETAAEFAGWGNPTGLVLAALGRNRRGIIASGGIRGGMDVAKSLALGAEIVGLALPFVRAVAAEGVPGVVRVIRDLERVLRTTMVLTSSRRVQDLRSAPLWFDPDFQARLDAFQAAASVARR